MKISEIMNKDCVFFNLKASNKRQLLQELAQKSSEITGINERVIFDALLERENLGTTGFGGGTALPHARLKDVDKIYGFFAKLNTPIAYEAIDNKAIDIVFMLLSPDSSGADHLTALAQISRLLKDESICEKIRNTSNNEEIYALLNN